MSVELGGLVLDIPAGAVVRRGRGRKATWLFTSGGRAPGIRRFEIRNDGRFRVQFWSPDLRDLDFDDPLDFSISLGTDIGATEIELDSRLRLRRQRSPRG